MTRPNPLVLFDCDGTLIDSQHVIVACMENAFARHGHPSPGAEAVRRIVGLSIEEAVMALMPGAEPRHIGPVATAYRDGFRTLRLSGQLQEPLFPGARAAVEALDAAGHLLGVATGKSRRGLDAVLALHGLRERFVTLQTADTHPSKPHPSMIVTAMAEAGAAPETTVMIGDTTYDIEMARAAGAHAIGVAWGYHPADELRDAGAHVVLDGFEALAPYVAALFDGEKAAP
ncbi:MAG: HAD-IA family hydrolase [Alphaproteobacteria bacterium]|nr:HAD-IA family hydrolase [Alphaproteobacteria bacterium]MDX5368125.1 HAD-IA family hydrolase [Alphaproteobacteria bacterium]MDX5462960.1 HAD-IA family hydrolase [Alphaproteobacteria bacterium]